MSDDLANQGRSVGRDLNNGFPVTVERCHIIEQMADRIEELEAKLARAAEAGAGVAASLVAAISLLERGGKKAAASDRMFAQMLLDYNASLDRFRTTLAKLKGKNDE